MTPAEMRAGAKLAFESWMKKTDEAERHAMLRDGYDQSYINIRQKYANESRAAGLEDALDQLMPWFRRIVETGSGTLH